MSDLRSDLRFWKRVFSRALERAYGMGGHEAFLAFKKGKYAGDGSLIKNADAYAVAEKMQQDLRESALWAVEKLQEG